MATSESIVAASAVVQTVATIVLVLVTLWYVRITKGILQTGQAQLADARSLLEASLQLSRNHLRAQLSKFTVIHTLPPAGIPESQMRFGAMWSATDEERLLELASRTNPEVSKRAGLAVPALMWLRELHTRINRTSTGHGYGTNSQEEKLYHQNRAVAEREIKALEELLG